MENQDIPVTPPTTPTAIPPRRPRNVFGLMLIIIGTFFLMDKLDLGIPDYVFSWPSILILIGILIGVRNDFRSANWLVLIVIGGVFLSQEIYPEFFHLRQELLWPVILIALGSFIFIRNQIWPGHYNDRCDRREWKRRMKQDVREGWQNAYWNNRMPPPPPPPPPFGNARAFASAQSASDDDFIYASAVFSGTQKTVLSKNFQGGNLTAMFGGLEVNMMQADINGIAVLNVHTFCGGTEIIVPGNWTVRLEETTMFGGSEDSRPPSLLSPDPNKVLIIRGSCVFGGLEVKSY